jgi:hypothetical protein
MRHQHRDPRDSRFSDGKRRLDSRHERDCNRKGQSPGEMREAYRTWTRSNLAANGHIRLLALLIAIAIITFCLVGFWQMRAVSRVYPIIDLLGSAASFCQIALGPGRFGATRPLMSRRRMSRSALSC